MYEWMNSFAMRELKRERYCLQLISFLIKSKLIIDFVYDYYENFQKFLSGPVKSIVVIPISALSCEKLISPQNY